MTTAAATCRTSLPVAADSPGFRSNGPLRLLGDGYQFRLTHDLKRAGSVSARSNPRRSGAPFPLPQPHPPTLLWLLVLLVLTVGCESSATPPVPPQPVAPTAEARAEIEADLAALAPPAPPEPAPSPAESAAANPSTTPPAAPTVASTGAPAVPSEPVAPGQPAPAGTSEDGKPTPSPEATPAKPTAEVASVPATRVRPSIIPAGPAVNPLPGGVRVLIPTKSFRPEGRERALRVVFDDLDLLKVLNMEPVTPDAIGLMPDWLRSLNGKTIRLRGFMYPPSFPDGITRFLLARDNQICCFGRNPKPYDIVAVTMKADVSTHYIENRPFDVVGTFHIEEQAFEDIETFSLYRLDDAIVIER